MSKGNREQADTHDIASGALINSLGIGASMLNFGFYFLLTHLYGAATTGLYLISWATVDMASKIGILGLDRAILSKAAPHYSEGNKDEIYRLIIQALLIGLIASTIIFLLLFGATNLIVTYFYHKPELLVPLRIMALGIPFWTISSILIHVTRAFRIMHYEILTKRIAEPVALLFFSALAYWVGLGSFGLASAFVLSTLVGAVLSAYFLNKRLPLSGLLTTSLSFKGVSALLKFSAPIGVYDLLNQFIQRIDLFFVGRFLPASAAGVYGIAQETAFALKKVRQAFDPIIIPVVSVSHAARNQTAMQNQYRYSTRWVLAINLGLVGVALLSGRLILSMFGNGFSDGMTAFALLALSVLINTSFGISELFILVDRPGLNVINSTVAAVCSVFLNLWLIPLIGINGAALACVLVFAVMNTIRAVEVYFLYKLSHDIGDVVYLVGAACLSLLFGVSLHNPWGDPDPLFEIIATVSYLLVYIGVVLAIRTYRWNPLAESTATQP
jgi:O-antigen/teichoic acid export membrane protein